MATNAPTLNLQGPLTLYSPEWWLRRLLARLQDQRRTFAKAHNYHSGRQPLAFASDAFNEAFRHRYQGGPANFMPLVVDATRERMIINGFRFGGEKQADPDIWRIWQENQMDAESQIAHRIALVKGTAYTLVAPPVVGHPTPLITIEDPYETTLETAPGNRRLRRAALKVWTDDDGYLRAYLFRPDWIYKFRAIQRQTDGLVMSWESTTWEPFVEEGDDFPMPNQLGIVPIIPLLNRPELDGLGQSEMDAVMGNQDAINKLRYDMLIASEAVAFPQRYMLNIDIPVDPDTGRPISPFRPGVTQLWATRRPTADEVAEYPVAQFPEPEFGQFPQASLDPYINALESEIGMMSSNSRTPYHYFLGKQGSVPPSGESLKSSEASLVKKVVAQQVHFGEGWEETMRVALIAAGHAAKARMDGETDWADPETRNEAARTDSILKQYAAGLLPDEIALEELGYSPQMIERIMAIRAAEPQPEPLPTPLKPVIRTFSRDVAGNPVINRSA